MYILLYILVYYTHGITTEWSYSLELYNEWYLPSFVEDWPVSNDSSLIVPIEKNSIYLRSEIQLSGANKYSGFAISIFHLSGIIIYINGIQIYYRFMENLNPSVDDFAYDRFDELTEIQLILPIHLLDSSNIVVGIELHRYSTEEEFPSFSFYMMLLMGDTSIGCINLNKFRKPITEHCADDGKYGSVEEAFDMIGDSVWHVDWSDGRIERPWATIRMKDNIFVHLNYFTVLPVSLNEGGLPKKVELKGTDKEGAELDIAIYDNLLYNNLTFISGHNLNFINHYFTSFTITIPEVYQGDYMIVSNLGFLECGTRYCNALPNFNISTSISGTITNISCVNNESTGMIVLLCPIEVEPQWIIIYYTCDKDRPLLLEKKTQYTFKSGNEYKDVKLVTFIGSALKYSMYPEIPGLTINSNTGYIDGKPYIQLNNTEIVITAKNGFNIYGENATILITIIESEAPILTYVNTSVILISGDNYNNLKLFELNGKGNFNIICLYLPKKLSFNQYNKSISGIPQDIGNYSVMFIATNSYGNLDFIIPIEIQQPFVPAILEENNLTLYYGEEYIGLHPLKCSGNSIHYSNNSILPFGLSFNFDTGELYGKLLEIPFKEYIILFKCTSGTNSLVSFIHINVTYSDYPIIMSYEKEINITVGKDYNNYNFSWVVGIDLVFTISPSIILYIL